MLMFPRKLRFKYSYSTSAINSIGKVEKIIALRENYLSLVDAFWEDEVFWDKLKFRT